MNLVHSSHKNKIALIISTLLFSTQCFAIIGGELVNEDSIITKSTVGLSNGCTGTLISKDLVLTAAHCLVRTNSISVIFGISFQTGAVIPASNFITHSGYDAFSGAGTSPASPASSEIHDIALIKLESQAPEGFTPALLGSGQNLEAGDPLILAGFGQTNPNGGSSGRLKAVDTVFNFYNSNALEIVFGPTPGQSACRGDSGGPMYVLNESNNLILIGVTSRGFASLGPCSGSGNYTEVKAHVDWINQTALEL